MNNIIESIVTQTQSMCSQNTIFQIQDDPEHPFILL